MTTASRQLDEMTEFFGTLEEADLRRPCPDDDAGDTVGAIAVHTAQGYALLGRFLQATGYVPGATGGGGHGHGPCRSRGGAPGLLPTPATLRTQVSAATAPIGRLADLTDEQLDSVPRPGSSRFADGHRSLEQVIDAVIDHQAAHLAALKQAVQ
ncbi:hypothetical protein EP51_44760 (plasmid) [Rhodococcus opacus]|uniref:DinB-like domain-containing protein n=2 Tax=Rhodococcus opacus TaxID=37919 RepID=A0A076F643_RHOOP|nr:hypothetical protein EP51_44760 [Rhodococcus opacus]